MCPFFTSDSITSLLTPSHSFILLFSHCLFFCPRLNSLTHSSESSTPPSAPHRGCHGDHRVQYELGGGLCLSVCVYVTVPQANMLPAGLRSEGVTCLLSQHSYLGQQGAADTRTHITYIPVHYWEPSQSACWYSFLCGIDILICTVCVHVLSWGPEHWRCSLGLQTSRPSLQNSIVSSLISPVYR